MKRDPTFLAGSRVRMGVTPNNGTRSSERFRHNGGGALRSASLGRTILHRITDNEDHHNGDDRQRERYFPHRLRLRCRLVLIATALRRHETTPCG